MVIFAKVSVSTYMMHTLPFVCKVIVAALGKLITYFSQVKFTFLDNCYVMKLLSDAVAIGQALKVIY